MTRLIDLDGLSTEDLAHLLAARRMAEIPTPAEQVEALREWDAMLARLADPDRDVDDDPALLLDPKARAYVATLDRVTLAAAEMSDEGYWSEGEITDALVRAAVDLGIDPGDAVDAVTHGLAQVAA